MERRGLFEGAIYYRGSLGWREKHLGRAKD